MKAIQDNRCAKLCFKKVLRGEIYYADFDNVYGSEQKGERPVLIIQNSSGNIFSPTTICALISTSDKKSSLPTHVSIDSNEANLPQNSVVQLEQIRTIDKKRLKNKRGKLSHRKMKEINAAIRVSLELI